MANRIVTGVEQDLKGRILALYGDLDEGWSPISTHEAVETMRAGVHTYTTVGRRGSAEVHPFRGDWVRTERTLVYEDNLDSLSGPYYAHMGAGAFGLVVTLSEAGVEALARELHASSAIVDRVYLGHGDLLVTAALGVPRFEPDGGAADAAAFTITRDAVCHIRQANLPSDAGHSVVATITTQCVASVTVAAREGFAAFTLAYTVPPLGALRLQSPLPEPARTAVLESLGSWVAESPDDRWTLPLTGLLAGCARVDARFAPTGAAQVGFRFDSKREGEFPDGIAGWDWTVALARPFVVTRISESLFAYLGGLPAPMGDAWRVEVPGGQDVWLNYLEVELVPGAIVVSGRALKGRNASVSATFSAQFHLSLDADGLVEATLGDTHVEVVEWYAQLADFLSGGALVAGLSEGLRSALGTFGAGAATSLLTGEVLTRIVATGTAGVAHVEAVPRRVWIEPGALHLGGDLVRAPVPPSLRPTVLDGRVDISMSATPGATLREVTWSANGASVGGSYEQRSLSWEPPTGSGPVTVTIVTDEGETATATVLLN